MEGKEKPYFASKRKKGIPFVHHDVEGVDIVAVEGSGSLWHVVVRVVRDRVVLLLLRSLTNRKETRWVVFDKEEGE